MSNRFTVTDGVAPIISEWATDISLREPKRMLSYYSQDAILLPTYDDICIGKSEILEYFVEFLDKPNLNCKITSAFIQSNIVYLHQAIATIGGVVIVCSGTYTFTFDDPDSRTAQSVDARFSYVIHNDMIINHHSSVMP